MPAAVFTDSSAAVKNLSDRIAQELFEFIDDVNTSMPQSEVERRVVAMVGDWGRVALGLGWSEQCRRIIADDIVERRLEDRDVAARDVMECRWQTMNTLGLVVVFSSGYRDRSLGVGSVTRTPARALFPRHKRSRSSDLCLQRACRLDAEQIFSNAQCAATDFTHGAGIINFWLLVLAERWEEF